MTVWGMWQYISLKVAEIVKENSYALAKERRAVDWKLTTVCSREVISRWYTKEKKRFTTD